jgi:Apea-like HEPN
MEFEQALHEDMIDYRYLTVLEGFRMEAEKVELGPQLSIIRISPAEQEEILSSDSMLTTDPLDQARKAVASHEYALEHYYTVPKVIGDPPEAPHSASPSQIVEERFAEACSALRLFKAGIFGHSAIWHYAPRGWLLSRVESHFSLMSFLRYGAQYLLSADEIQPFSGFWQSYQCARQTRRKAIDVALRRLNFGYERIRPEDRLIDYSIGFEALLLGDNRQELSYRLALRGAALLGKTPEQRKQIFDELNRAYGLRSDIVPGTTIKEPIHLSDRRISFDDFVASIEGYLRSAIKEFLTVCQHQNESAVIKTLDTQK